MSLARTNNHTTPVSQAIARPDSELARLRLADKGCISPMAGGRRREVAQATPMAFHYHLRNTQTHTYRRERAAGPCVRPATSPTKGGDTNTGTRCDTVRKGRNRVVDVGRINPAWTGIHGQAERLYPLEDQTLTMQLVVLTRYPLCTACYVHPHKLNACPLEKNHEDPEKGCCQSMGCPTSWWRSLKNCTLKLGAKLGKQETHLRVLR